MTFAPLALLLVLVLAGPASAAAVDVREGVRYGTAPVATGEVALRLDLYRPAHRASALRPLVILVHGGAFRTGSRTDPGVARIAHGLAARGIVAASIDYRLLGDGPEPSARVAPLADAMGGGEVARAVAAAADDTLTAVRYLRGRARRLGIDRRRLGLIGSSAGAITADHVAYALDDHGIRGPRLRFVGSLWGGLLAPGPGGTPPAAQLDTGEPPLFAVHGDADPTVPVAWSDDLVARARRRGVPAEYHRIPGGTHGYGGSRFFVARVTGGRTPFERLLAFARARLRR
jgi:acetyl esterase/lipase